MDAALYCSGHAVHCTTSLIERRFCKVSVVQRSTICYPSLIVCVLHLFRILYQKIHQTDQGPNYIRRIISECISHPENRWLHKPSVHPDTHWGPEYTHRSRTRVDWSSRTLERTYNIIIIDCCRRLYSNNPRLALGRQNWVNLPLYYHEVHHAL